MHAPLEIALHLYMVILATIWMLMEMHHMLLLCIIYQVQNPNDMTCIFEGLAMVTTSNISTSAR